MKTMWMWFLMSCKRYGKRFAFLGILFLLPIGALAARHMQGKGEQGIGIAIAVQDNDKLARQIAERLVNRSLGENDGMFRFYLCEDEEQVKEEVASRRAECGYVIYEGLKEKLDSGSFRRTIGVYSAPSTVAAALSTETVFAALVEIYNRELLEDYAGKGEVFETLGLPGSQERAALIEDAGTLYDRRLTDGSTFRFEYAYLGQERTAVSSSDQESPVFPVRGVVAVYLFITSLYAGVVLGEDERKGLFLPLSYGHRLPCALASLAAPVVMAAVSALLALWMGGSLSVISLELGAMACYCLSLIAVSWLLKSVTRSPQVLCSSIPFFTIGSFLFCPVFIDGGRFIEGFHLIGRLFPPWYYLRFFSV